MPTEEQKCLQNRAQRADLQERIRDILEIGIDAQEDQNKITEFKVRYNQLERLYASFEIVQNKIINHVSLTADANLDEHRDIRKEVDINYFKIKAIYEDLGLHDNPETTEVREQTERPASSNVRLPKIDIPVFCGNLKEWPSFRDLFKTLIDSHPSLSNIEKFHYLLSVLSKEPLTIVKGVSLSGENYPIAFQNLMKRYDNKRLLAVSYWRELIDFPKLDKENSVLLRKLLNIFTENLAALDVLGFQVDQWDFPLFNILLDKLDLGTRTQFELSKKDVELPAYSDLVAFLSNHCKAMEQIDIVKGKASPSSLKPQVYTSKNNQNRLSKSALVVNTESCIVCKGSHSIYSCSSLLELSPHDRYRLAKTHKLCLSCLRSTHQLSSCPSKSVCKTCKSNRHHSLLHFQSSKNSQSINRGQSESVESDQPLVQGAQNSNNSPDTLNPDSTDFQSALVANFNQSTTVLLSTAEIMILNAQGKPQKVRALLDNASQVSFMTESCLKKLGIKFYPVAQTVYGIGAAPSLQLKGKTKATIHSIYSTEPQFLMDFFVCPQICAELPNHSFSSKLWPHLSNLKLADPHFSTSRPIDILLSADVFCRALSPGKLQTSPNEPVALNTLFGWILCGTAQLPTSSFVNVNTLITLTDECCITLNKNLQNFWKLEEVPMGPLISAEDQKCEQIYDHSTCVNEEGRYVVELPFISKSVPTFEQSRSIAYRRLLNLENKLSQNDTLRIQYQEFMKDYRDSNHMSVAPPLSNANLAYYIPHHAVMKPDSSTTKLRVVFNASQKTANGISLNDLLFTGPKLQKDISILLIRFRMHSVVFSADIQQMYRQILVAEHHRNFQRILWRDCPKDSVQEFILNTVTYGTKPAPFLAQRTLKQLAIDKGDLFPLAKDIIENDCFVDDFLSGSTSLEQASMVIKDLQGILHSAGFHLRKWTSNIPELLANIPDADKQFPSSMDFDSENSVVKLLGLRWNAVKDYFTYHVQVSTNQCTKRTLLSELARIYDPLGLLSPLTFLAKHIIQLLWSLQLSWDDPPPEEIINKWNFFKNELSSLSNLEIPRYINLESAVVTEVHAFCDASEKGFGSCVYLRLINSNSEVKVSLIVAKSKVAPLKTLSVPRLELCAAVLLAKLMDLILPIIKSFVVLNRVVAYSDSRVVLAWLNSPPYRWKTFVGNRVAFIQEKVDVASWTYIPSEENPADIVSRGCMPSELLNNSLWWAGPTFLNSPDSIIDRNSSSLNFEEIEDTILAEEKKVVLTTVVETNFLLDLIGKFSSLDKLQRIVAYWLRFLYFLKHKVIIPLPLSFHDLNRAMKCLVRAVQQQAFAEEISALKTGKSCSKAFRKLSPFFDEDDLLRVGGRLVNSRLGYEKKFPMLLPSTHVLTNLVIDHFHKIYFHPGLRTLQFLISQQFWILSPRRAIYRVVSKCIKCFKIKPRSFQPIMGNLPTLRVSQAKAFSCVSVDFGGPFMVKSSQLRGCKVQKAYLCLFVCFATKAIHLELASDLSTECFLAAFRRFIARRGRCSYVFSDNGTNFVGAHRYLVKIMKDVIAQEKIRWSFSPPVTPNFNGLAEAGIKSAKSYLKKVVGEQVLTFEEFYTILVQIEAILNSRPLVDVSSDPNDFSVLTPGHFLTLEPLTSIPDPDLSHLKLNQLNRWQLLQKIHQDFWKRWHLEYLNSMMQRSKSTSEAPILRINDLVLLKDDNLPPLRWKLGRVINLHPGDDGIVRVATVKTTTGIFKRGVVKLCPLPKLDP